MKHKQGLITWGLVVLVLGLIGLGAWAVLASLARPQTSVTIGGTVIRAQVVSSDDDLMKGLSGVDSLDEGKGMLFVFPRNGPQEMWMKDMKISLDIIWINENHTVVTVEHDLSPQTYPQRYRATAPARYVLEVPAGTAAESSIRPGMTAAFDLPAGHSAGTISS